MLAPCERLGDPAGEGRYLRKAAIQPKTLLAFRLCGAMRAVGAPISRQSRKKQRGEFAAGTYRCRIDRPAGVEELEQLLARAIVVPGPVKHSFAARQRASRLYAVRALTKPPRRRGHASAFDDATVHKKDSTMNGHTGMLVANTASV